MKEGFYVLKDEKEFDRFLTALLSSLGTALMQKEPLDTKDVDELMDITMHNIMFLCAEYHGLVNEGKIEPVEQPEGKTKEELRTDVLAQLKTVEQFFKISAQKQQEEKNNDKE